jgi:predicted  nucleic acid-binding Zn-ribbon protein
MARSNGVSKATNSLSGSDLIGPALFFGFFAVGLAYILAAKSRDMPQVYVTFGPVVVMTAYALVIVIFRALRVRDDQAGDNLYYMGFLFTLVSLGSSLYHFSGSGSAEEIVQNFGIAIASTIWGIAMRILFNQMRRDPAEVERIARVELAEAARRVRRELDNTVLEFNHFRRSAQQAIMEGFTEVSTHVDEVSKKLLAGLEDVTTKSAAPLEAASKHSGNTIEEVTKTMVAALQDGARELSKENERLSQSAASIAAALDKVSERLTAMQAPDEVIRIKLEPTIKGVASAVDRFGNKIDQHEKNISGSLDAARTVAETSANIVSQIRQDATATDALLKEALTSAQGTLQSLADTVSTLQQTTSTQADRFEALVKKTDEAITIATKTSAQDAAQAESLAKVLPTLERSAAAIEIAVGKLTSAPVSEPIDLAPAPASEAPEPQQEKRSPIQSIWVSSERGS